MIWRHVASNFLTLAVVILIAAAGAIAWGKRQYSGPGPSAVAQCVQVAQGASLSAVSDQLKAQGAITSSYIFRAGVDRAGKARNLKFGSYLVKPHASMADIADVITAGGPSTCGTEVIFRVGVRGNAAVLREVNPDTGIYEERERAEMGGALPAPLTEALGRSDARLRLQVAEGVTSWQVVQALNAIDMLNGEISGVPPEGSLAPDTYALEQGMSRQKILTDMTAAQERILAAAWEARPFDLPYQTPEEALIMASIVEKETGIAAERPTVASVFVNRLRDGMRLETDPTVIYGITQGREVLERGLRRSELQKKTPWNTYQISGLPKTPIANPGKAAIEAALNPADTDFLFFVADGTGGHVFARTLAEHQVNVTRWRAIEAQGGTVPGQGEGTGVSGG